MQLEKELVAAGCTMDPEEFRRMVVEMCVDIFPGFSEEDVAHSSERVSLFCDTIRSKARCPGLADAVIMKTLTNRRKQGKGVAEIRRRRKREEECLQTTWYFA
jgi:hypothetical protein